MSLESGLRSVGGAAVLLCVCVASAAAQTETSSATRTASVALPPPSAAPAVAPVQNLATPIGIPVAPGSRGHWSSRLRTEFVLLSTARWQIDNGDRTTIEDPDWNPTGEDFGDLVTTIGGSIGYEKWLLAARIDTAFYFHRPVAADTASPLVQLQLEDRYVDQFRHEYLALSYSDRDLSFTLGDYYMTLGRGMVLSVRKVGDVGVDNKITGAKGSLRWRTEQGDLSLTTFGGWLNIKNYESGTGFYYPERPNDARDPDGRFYDALDFITGGAVEYRLGKYLKVGAHGALINSPDDELDPAQTAEVRGYGAYVELPRPVPWLSFYAEIARITRDDTRLELPRDRRVGQALTDIDEEGWGVYTNANMYFGPATLLLEGKYYDNMFNVFPRGIRQPKRQVLNRLVEPPTAERAQTLLLANNTVWGGRARLDYRVARGYVPYVGLGGYRDNSFGRAPDGAQLEGSPPTNIIASFLGARILAKWGELNIEGGYRTQRRDYEAPADGDTSQEAQRARDLDGAVFRDDLHALVDWRQPLFAGYSMELAVNYLYAGQENAVNCDNLPQTSDDPDTQANIEACANRRDDEVFKSRPERWHEGRVALSFISSDKWSVTGAYEFYTLQPEVYDQHYFSIAGQYEFMQGAVIRALYGGERAGLKCSGGVCRFFPGFEGGRIELNMRL